MSTVNMQHGSIRVSSGDTVPLVKTLQFDEGDLSFDETNNEANILQRGRLSHKRRGDDEPVTFSFSAKLKDKTLRRTLKFFIWEAQTKSITGLTPQVVNTDQALDYPFEQGSVAPASGEVITTKLAAGTAPTGDNEFSEEVGSADVEGITVVGNADAATPVPGELSIQPPAADVDMDVVYSAVGQSTLDPGTSDVKTLLIELIKTEPGNASTVRETYALNHARLTSVSQEEGEEFDLISFEGTAFITDVGITPTGFTP